MKKNIAAQTVSAELVSAADGSDITTGTVSVLVTGDNGSQAAGAGTVAHKGNGLWSYVPTQAETNFDHVVFTFTHASAITASIQVYPVDSADLQAACAAALVAIHLDHLFAAAYDPSSKPGEADALLNELVENDGGVSRFTANALEAIMAQARAEPASVPAANAGLGAKIDWLFALGRNKVTNDGTEMAVRNDDDSGDIGVASVAESLGVLTRGEFT